jgi:hypothetical protein
LGSGVYFFFRFFERQFQTVYAKLLCLQRLVNE